MQLTRQAQYAVRTVLDLSLRPQGRLGEIAARQGIPRSYMARVVHGLNRAGIIRTRRGVGGGVQLARPATRITLGEVIAAAEGPLAVNLCVLWKDCICRQPCPVRAALARLEAAMKRELAVTVAELAARLPPRARRRGRGGAREQPSQRRPTTERRERP